MDDKQERPGVLALEDGTLFYGRTSSPDGIACGEIVFNTSMTGYQEVCTDPSYAGQMVLFTTSHIGNVGVNAADHESCRPWVKGVIVREMSKAHSNWRSEQSFIAYLNAHQVAWIEGLDTRKLTRHISKNGTKNACLMVGGIDTDLAIELARRHGEAKTQNLATEAVKKTPHTWHESVFYNGTPPDGTNDVPQIVVYDFGVKSSILSMLAQLGCKVTIIPHTAPAAEVLAYNPDGIILSNGPGDPMSIGKGIEDIQQLIFSGIPVLGICLGCQLIAIAAGASTRQLKFGQHGVNHPVRAIENGKIYITSQNHHFVVDAASLPAEFEVTHISLFDSSVQGIRSKNYPVIGFQGHPEGAPGPQDAKELFEAFLIKVRDNDAARSRY